MNLKNIFSNTDKIAWVGSGGKTSLIFGIVNHYFEKALVTTTTKLCQDEISLAKNAINLNSADISEAEFLLNNHSGSLLIFNACSGTQPNKILSPTTDQLSQIKGIAEKMNIPLFIEADGSRRMPVKAPGENEPVIPEWVNKVCVVVGLSGLNQPIQDQHVFRHELFRQITNTKNEDRLTLALLEQYLSHPNGGLKNIPANAKKILFLNQADQIPLCDEIFDFCLKMRQYYDHVILSTVKEGKVEINALYGKITAVILAAGGSKRFGSPKQLVIWKNKTLIEHVIHNVIESGLKSIKIVLGANAEMIKQKIQRDRLTVLINHNWEKGQSTSVKFAIQNLSSDTEAVLFVLVDQPQISAELINQVVQLFAKTQSKTVACEYNGVYTHPILFSAEVFNEFTGVSGDIGGKNILKKYPPAVINLPEAYLMHDVDTADDLKKL